MRKNLFRGFFTLVGKYQNNTKRYKYILHGYMEHLFVHIMRTDDNAE